MNLNRDILCLPATRQVFSGGNQINILDHGMVKMLNVSGPVRRADQAFDADDTDPAKVARISFDNLGADRSELDDLKLCNYLMKNKHTSPFEMIEIWLEMKIPMFLARQIIRHRTASVNEVSGRYVQLPAEWYVPEKVGAAPINAKQGQSDGLNERIQADFKMDLHNQCKISYGLYECYIANGVAPEHARLFLHMNHYTHWVWKQDLHNIMHLLALRVDSHAQKEANALAEGIIALLRRQLPESMALFDKYRRLTPTN